MERRGYIHQDIPFEYDDHIIPEVRDRRSRGYYGTRYYDRAPEIWEPQVHHSRVIRDISPHRRYRHPEGGQVVYETRLKGDPNDLEVAGYMDYDVEMAYDHRPVVINERDYLRERGYRERNHLPRNGEVKPMITDQSYRRDRRYGDRIEEVIPDYYRKGRYDRRYGDRIEEVIHEGYRNGDYRRERRDVEVIPEFFDSRPRHRSRRRQRGDRIEEIIPDDYRDYDRNYFMQDRPHSNPLI